MVCLTAFFVASAQEPQERLKKFHAAYAGKWPATITYVRNVEWTQYNRNETYKRYHAIKFPSKKREDININSGTSHITIDDHVFIIKEFRYKGSLPARRDLENYIPLYCYSESWDQVREHLNTEGVDLSKGYSTSWRGRKVYVIGTNSSTDSVSTQIWYDEKDMHPVKLVQTFPNDYNRYEFRYQMSKTGNIWFPTEMEEYRNKRRIYKSTYTNLQTDVILEPGVFNPDKFGSYLWYEYSAS